MKLPSKTICQLSALSRALTDPQADDFEAMDTHDMLMLVVEIAKAHTKLEDAADDAAFKLMAVKDTAITAIDVVNAGAPSEFAGELVHEILEIIHEEA